MRTPSAQFNTGYAAIPEIMLWVALLVGCACMATFVLAGYDVAGSYILIPIMMASGAVLIIIPIAIILAIIKRTRRIGGALFYVSGAFWLIYIWLYVFFLLYQRGGKWWTIAGVVASFFSSGFGIFAVFTLLAAAAGQWLPLLYILLTLLVCRLVCNIGRGLMGVPRIGNAPQYSNPGPESYDAPYGDSHA